MVLPDLKLSPERLAQLCGLAEQAGAEVMAVYGTAFNASVKDDHSPVTEADLRADAVICAGLSRLFPGVPIISEESLPSSPPPSDRPFFLVDPLDGTKEFIARTGEFTVNIALVDRGVAVAGVVLAPASGELFYAAHGLGAFRHDSRGTRPLKVRPYDPDLPLRVVGSRSHGGARLAAWLESLPVTYEFAPAGSSLKFCRVAEGCADVYPRLGPTSLWDTAAAQCILEQAGGRVTDLAGRPLLYDARGGWLNPEFVAWSDKACLAFCECLRASGVAGIKTGGD
jgi:3'(2'),5'-bisphosphate nucleotidase